MREFFKNRCSYMIYSAAFGRLPERVKAAVFAKLTGALAGDAEVGAHLPDSEKRRIRAILDDTLPEWREKN